MLGAEHMLGQTGSFLPLFFNPFLNQVEPDGRWSERIVFTPGSSDVTERQQRVVYLLVLPFIFLPLSIDRITLADSPVVSSVKMLMFSLVRHLQSLRRRDMTRWEVGLYDVCVCLHSWQICAVSH